MKKKLIIFAAVALMCVMVMATWAYFTAEETTTNVISTGSLDLELYEKAIVNGEEVDYVEPQGGLLVLPGATVSKIPYIKNNNGTDFYTRARIDVTFTQNGQTIPTRYIEFSVDESQWQKSVDANGVEWYYYKGIVKTNETVKLFDTVKFSEAMGNNYGNARVQIDVSAQAVQAKNNEAPGGDYTKVTGWPE